MNGKYDNLKINMKGYTPQVLEKKKNFLKTYGFCSLEPTINLCCTDKGNCREIHTGVKTFDMIFF